jgi:Zn ribbon nucleic-acid-binding protein
MHNKCRRFKDIVIQPDGQNELNPCKYDEVSRYENVTVSVLKCRRCGHIEIELHRQPNTTETHLKKEQDQ